MQSFECSLGISPRLDRQHFDTLSDQHSGLPLHLRAMLQILNGFDPLGQLYLQACQWFFRQWCARLGSVSLPSQRIGQIELGGAK